MHETCRAVDVWAETITRFVVHSSSRPGRSHRTMGKRAAPTSAAAKNAASAKRERKMTEDQIVKKAIDDNFKGWTHEAIFVRLHDGLTLFDRIKKDKQSKRVVFGARYYASLREAYRSPEDVMTALKARNPSEDRLSGMGSGGLFCFFGGVGWLVPDEARWSTFEGAWEGLGSRD